MSTRAQPPSPFAKSPSPVKSPISPAKSPSPAAAGSSPIPETTALVADENPEVDTNDLGIEVDAESDTTSLRSSILKYREENGRTYHAYKDGSYPIPNDDAENERLDLQHALSLLTFDNKLYVSHLEKQPHRVLDAGCGTGIWSIEFADEHPEAHVTGVDLSPIQPAFVPPNCHFYVDDIEDPWTFSAPFDFVFSRYMTGSITDWPRFFKQSFDNLTPGGVIELQDFIYPLACDDGTLAEDSALKRWSVLMADGFRRNKRPLDTVLNYEEQLADAGFVDIGTVREKWPTNCWPRAKKYKQLGIWDQENILNGLAGLSLATLTRPTEENGFGWSREEVEVLLAQVRKDVRNTSIHAYFRLHVVYARKPY